MNGAAIPVPPFAGRETAAAVAAVVGVCAVSVVSVPAEGSWSGALQVVARAVAVGTPLAVGLYALRRPPFERFGRLLIATAIVALLVTLALSDQRLAYSVGRVATWVLEAWLIYLML